MGKLVEHFLSKNRADTFPSGEYTNATRFLYTAIGAAIHDKADKLVVKTNGFEWYRGTAFAGKHLGGETPEPTQSYRTNLHNILRYDAVAKQCLIVEHEGANEIIVRILPED